MREPGVMACGQKDLFTDRPGGSDSTRSVTITLRAGCSSDGSQRDSGVMAVSTNYDDGIVAWAEAPAQACPSVRPRGSACVRRHSHIPAATSWFFLLLALCGLCMTRMAFQNRGKYV